LGRHTSFRLHQEEIVMRTLIACAVFVVLAGFTAAADDKIDAKKLIGKWEPAKAEAKGKLIIDIQDKGKFVLNVEIGDKTEKIEGTYKLNGNKLDIEMSFGGKTTKETLTIVKVTDTELVTKGKNDKEETLKRVK
jgi:uncharacterized protein (TIGR03066 family)